MLRRALRHVHIQPQQASASNYMCCVLQELSSKRVVLRVRFYDGDKKAVVTVKGKQVGPSAALYVLASATLTSL